MTFIKEFSEIRITDIPKVGGKNAGLGELFSQLTSKGIKVPPGFAVVSEGYFEFLNYNKFIPELTSILSQLNIKTFHSLREIS